MRYGLFGIAVMAAFLSTGAGAETLGFADESHSDPAAALRNKAEVPAECLDAVGANTCIGLLIAEDAGEGPLWRFAWATPDTNAICVDAATANYRVKCDASDAVRIVWESPMMVCGPNRTNCHRPPMPELPYRPDAT
ncbi:hypothetical protein [Brevundimonas sp. GCM10030266]|uniref:hypothetical protein n=1 Tax=Brevundimonas sp. GCM10030266 TaxID=3273386 RepID=UPI0036237EDE